MIIIVNVIVPLQQPQVPYVDSMARRRPKRKGSDALRQMKGTSQMVPYSISNLERVRQPGPSAIISIRSNFFLTVVYLSFQFQDLL